jgi:type III pantothenate kinase
LSVLLVVDIGNSTTAVGVVSDDRVAQRWRLSTITERTADEYRLLFQGLLASNEMPLEGAAVSSVVPAATAAVQLAAADLVAGPVVVVGPGVRTGLAIHTDNPREVGADRVVNAVAAIERYGAPVVVVDFGTATTVDVVGPAGDYLGGMIAPGLEVSMNGLVGHTAALRRVELVAPPRAIGRNTVTAIQSGLLYGHAGMIDRAVDMIANEIDAHPAVVATGGLAPVVAPLCRTEIVVDDSLTLEGLRIVYRLQGAP